MDFSLIQEEMCSGRPCGEFLQQPTQLAATMSCHVILTQKHRHPSVCGHGLGRKEGETETEREGQRESLTR